MTFPVNQVGALSNKLVKKRFTMGVMNSNKGTQRFLKNKESEDGGTKITCPLATVDDTGTTGGFYARGATLPLTEYDGISASEHEWKMIQETIVIPHIDIAKNSSKHGILKLVKTKQKLAEAAMAQRIMKSILLGTGGSNDYIGLDTIIAASGTYGQISSSDLATWLSYVDDNGGSLRTYTQTIEDKAFDQTVEEGLGGATVSFAGKAVFTKFKGLLTGQQRVTRENTVSGQGHKGQVIVYNGIDHLIENNMPANTKFFVDEKHSKLHVHKDHFMRRQRVDSLEASDALMNRIFLYSAFASAERKFNSRVNDITV